MKKSLRSIISLILSILLMVCAFPVSSLSYVENSEYRYTVENGEVIILDYLGSDVDIVIPSTIDELPVTHIASRAFQQVSGLKTVTVPACVRVIEGNVFDFNPGLTDVFVDEENPYFKSVDGILFDKEMSTLLFYPDGKDASSYKVPESVTVVGAMAFGGCDNLRTVELPEGLLFIGQNAFFMNDGIRELHLPDSLIAVGDEAFDYCDELHTVTMGKNLEYIGEAPFNNCPSLKTLVCDGKNTNYMTVDNVLYSSMDELVRYPEGKEFVHEYPVLEGTKVICDSAFFSCDKLNVVTLPDSVETIDEYAFYHCRFNEINFSENLKVIEDGAFYDCQNLEEIIVPESVNTIGTSAFGACINLKKAVLPYTLSHLGTDVFNNCPSLVKVTLPENLRVIPDSTFRYCVSLTELPDLNGADTIGDSAFMECHSLNNITIPESVTTIENHAFANCHRLGTVTIGPNVTTFGFNVFRSDRYDVTIEGYRNTAAEKYAQENGHLFVYLDEEGNENTEPSDPDPSLPDPDDDNNLPSPEKIIITLGDSDLSGKVTIKDATVIQKNVAGILLLHQESLACADVDNNDVINVKDATMIQKYLADIEVPAKIGTKFTIDKDEGGYVYIKDSANWSNICCYCWNDTASNKEWPGEKAELIGEVDGAKFYRYYVSGIFTSIIVGSGINDNYSRDALVDFNAIFDTASGDWEPLLLN